MKLQGNEEKEWDFKKILMKNQVSLKIYGKKKRSQEKEKAVENAWTNEFEGCLFQ